MPWRERLRFGVILTLFMCLSVFLMSVDNPWTHTPALSHVDSAGFFMGGKAWANGLIPYSDFADGKGPLLWFITMLAYLISPADYMGVMVMTAVVMSGAVYFSWLTAVRIVGDARLGIWCAAPMIIVWFVGYEFFEARCETYAQLPLAYLLYVLVSGMRSPGLLSPAKGIWSGVAICSMVLIKWSMGVIGGCIVAGHFVILLYNRGALLRYVISCIIGLVIFALPFVVYLLSVKAFDDCIRECFINIFAISYMGSSDSEGIIKVISGNFSSIYQSGIKSLGPTVGILIGNGLAYYKFKKWKWLPGVVICIAMLALVISMQLMYYMQAIGFAAISLFAWLVTVMTNALDGRLRHRMARLWAVALLVSLFIPLRQFTLVYLYDVHNTHRVLSARERAGHAVSQWCQQHGVVKPRISYPYCLEFGVGIRNETLPATRYWFMQNGASAEMRESIHKSIEAREADILVVTFEQNDKARFERCGYTIIFDPQVTPEDAATMWTTDKFFVWAKNGI